MTDIVIVTYNAWQDLEACLDSVRKFTLPGTFRLIIVNNGCTDATADLLKSKRRAEDLILDTGKNLGFSGGANFTIPHLQTETTLFLDDDTLVTEGWLDGLEATLRRSTEIGMVTPKLLYPEKLIFYCEGRTSPLRTPNRLEKDFGQADYIKEVDIVTGACFLMRRDLFEKVGLFDESFYPCQFEDTDYAIRTRKAGYKIVYNGFVTVWHSNLYRNGGKKVNAENQARFLKKWEGITESNFLFPDSHIADQLMHDAIEALRDEEYEEALQICERLGQTEPKFVELWIPALALVRLHRYQEALIPLKEMIRRNPNNYSARNYITLALRELGINTEANELTQRMLSCVTQNIKKKRAASF